LLYGHIKKMIQILIPDNFIPERKYIINIFFNEFLGLDYQEDISNIKHYEIILENKKKLVIKDDFFSRFDEGLTYLAEKNIPKKVKFTRNKFIIEDNIPVIFGDNELKVDENEILCGIDIFASSFFMLSRWEEYFNKIGDVYGRFPVIKALAYKNKFIERPIVNEYLEMLWNMLTFLSINQNRKERKFELVLTHDVDYLYKMKLIRHVLKTMGGDVLKRKSLKLALSRVNEYIKIKKEKKKDPYDTFDYLMDKSESIGKKSHFYFMSGGITKKDNHYKIEEAHGILQKILRRGHIVGFHGSYSSYNNPVQWRKEKKLLAKFCKYNPKEGRQHFLMFEVPTTWQIWEDNNMKIDSTLTYPDKEGFRCGTGDLFSTFNIKTRKKLNLKEMPLIIMEGTLLDSIYRGLSSDEALKIVKYYIDISKKYNSKLTLLWHNSSFIGPQFSKWGRIYEIILNYL